MSDNIQKTLEQIFEVAFLVYRYNYDRNDATKRVARKHRVTQNTITSACTRGININAYQLDEYLKVKNAGIFRDLLVQRFPYYHKQVEVFFADILNEEILDNLDELSNVVKQILPEELKYTISKIYFNLMNKKFEDWINRKDVPEDIKSQIIDWLKKFSEFFDN